MTRFKLISKSIFLMVFLCFGYAQASKFKSTFMKKYPMEKWQSARHTGDEYNYDNDYVWVENADPLQRPLLNNKVFLPRTPDVIHAFPGRYFYYKKDKAWELYRFNKKLEDIEKLSAAEYTQMFTWGNNSAVVGGLKKDNTIDMISTFHGKVIVNMKDIDITNPVSKARNAIFVRMKDGTFRNIQASLKPDGEGDKYWDEYPAEFSLSPYTYYFGGEIQNISFGLREVDGQGHVDIFFRGQIKDLNKNYENTKDYNKEYVAEQLKYYAVLNLGKDPEKRFVIIRDGEITPKEYEALDSEKVKNLIPMKASKGRPSALALIMNNDKGEPRIHLLNMWDYWGASSRRYKHGTLKTTKFGLKDATGSYFINTYNYLEYPVVVGLFEDNRWNYVAGELSLEREYTGYDIGPKNLNSFDSLPIALKAVREMCATHTLSAEQIAKQKFDYEAKVYRDSIRARDVYQQAIKQIEFRKKMAEYEAAQQASAEFREALGSISGSLTRGATSNTPTGPRGYEDKYDNTGAGYNRYQKKVESDAKRKARPGN